MAILLSAAEVMDRVAVLLNDPDKTDYTYTVQLPYLNIAIDELLEHLEESNSPAVNATTSPPILVPVGTNKVLPPQDMVEIQEVGERLAGTQDAFVFMPRREFIDSFPPSSALLYWALATNAGVYEVQFNPNGATTAREIRIRYLKWGSSLAYTESSMIPIVNSRSYLSFKTAALCAQFVGENESRAGILNTEAEQALERMLGIENKGKQQIMTRHRPFRASYKSRGGI